jgi:ABC-2 type transport system ATP-binding protein
MITISNFSKSFGEKVVVQDLSFDVNPGEVFAFLGANGSGKTTTIRCLLGIYENDSGELLINGKRYDNTMVSMLGYLPEERGLYLSSKVLETLVYFGQLKQLTYHKAYMWTNEYLEKVGLSGHAQSEIKKLSSGQQQKIQLGIALINDPKLLILDEPTKGLDPVNRDLLIDMLLELNHGGATVVFITHQMEEVEKIADRLVMIKDGKRILYGPLDDVKAQFGTNTIHIQFKGEIPQNEAMYSYSAEKNTAEIYPKEGCTETQVIRYLLQHDVEIQRYEVATPSLHEIFVKVSREG